MLRRASLLVGLVVVAALSAPLASASPEDRGHGDSEMLATHYAGKIRDALVYVPRDVPDVEPVPLVLVLHGLGADAQTAAQTTGMSVIADQEKVVVVYPYGLNNSWNSGWCCGTSAATHVDDVGLLTHFVQLVSLTRRIDPRRVYIAGYSNGGMMALRAACERPDVFAAAASVAGTLTAPCRGTGRISALFLHGARDKIVPLDGLRYSRALHSPLMPVPQAAATVAARAGCRAHTDTVAGNRRTTQYTGCADGNAVQIEAFSDLGHTWPTASQDRIDGARIVWDFLRQHERAG